MTKAEEGVELLGAVDLFQGLGKSDLLKIHMLGRREQVRAGRELTSEGESGGHFYLIISGRAKVEVGGKEVPGLGPGDYFGEISLIDGEPRSATVTAETDLEVLSLASFTFRPLLLEHAGIAYKILLEMCARLRAAEST